ncbi:MAG: enoyl-CoA hydratase/isomerase family protein [Bacteroidia bacterium]|nr:enoyl-CoA hydratase/isomerase family protein [Bacteroidia bacterium]
MEELILKEREDRTGYITLNREEKRNALSPALIRSLLAAFTEMENDDDIKTIVLKAKGEIFSAGADLAYLQQLQSYTLEENLADSRLLKDLYQKIYINKKAVIGQVEGHAIAGGCGLATVCDFVFAVPEAKFGYTESRIGFVPALVMVYLLRKIGEAKAKPMLIKGDLISASKAHEFGLVYEIIEKKQIEDKVKEFCDRINTSVSSHSISQTKQMIAQIRDMDLESGLEFASMMNAKARGHADCKEGISKFLNKEKIKW